MGRMVSSNTERGWKMKKRREPTPRRIIGHRPKPPSFLSRSRYPTVMNLSRVQGISFPGLWVIFMKFTPTLSRSILNRSDKYINRDNEKERKPSFFFLFLTEKPITIEKMIIPRVSPVRRPEIIYTPTISNFHHGNYRTIYPVKFSSHSRSPSPFFNNDLS